MNEIDRDESWLLRRYTQDIREAATLGENLLRSYIFMY
jgi:hypothetical protein